MMTLAFCSLISWSISYSSTLILTSGRNRMGVSSNLTCLSGSDSSSSSLRTSELISGGNPEVSTPFSASATTRTVSSESPDSSEDPEVRVDSLVRTTDWFRFLLSFWVREELRVLTW